MSRSRPYVVGLTGGIGSGKTTVCKLFAEAGVEIVDADTSSRRVVVPGSSALRQLIEWYGETVLLPDGNLNRRNLRELIFSDTAQRLKVEALLHPLIRSDIQTVIDNSQSHWLILAAPLLLENNAYDFVDRILVVDAEESLQISRTQQRDQCTEESVRTIMAMQLGRPERLRRADDIIYNNTDLANLRTQVQACYSLYQKIFQDT